MMPSWLANIYQAVELELKGHCQSDRIREICTKVELPDLEPKSVVGGEGPVDCGLW